MTDDNYVGQDDKNTNTADGTGNDLNASGPDSVTDGDLRHTDSSQAGPAGDGIDPEEPVKSTDVPGEDQGGAEPEPKAEEDADPFSEGSQQIKPGEDALNTGAEPDHSFSADQEPDQSAAGKGGREDSSIHDYEQEEPKFDTQTGERLDKPKSRIPGIILTAVVTGVAVGAFLFSVLPGGIPSMKKAPDDDAMVETEARLVIADSQRETETEKEAETEAAMTEALLSGMIQPQTEEQTQKDSGKETEGQTEGKSGEPDLKGGVSLNVSLDVSKVAADTMPGIVSITSRSIQTVESFFYGRQQAEADAAGSGIIVDEDENHYYIVTDAYLVDNAEQITAGFFTPSGVEPEKSLAQASVLGTDIDTELAVLSVKKADLDAGVNSAAKVSVLGNSDSLRVGQRAVAIGNALGYGQSVTQGVISALGREMQTQYGTHTYIQTDASINYGNYGGALLNTDGEVIGINAGKVTGNISEGMGYALPINAAKESITDMIAGKGSGLRESQDSAASQTEAGMVQTEPDTAQTEADPVQTEGINSAEDGRKAGTMGVRVADISEENQVIYRMPAGVYVASVEKESGAGKAGLKADDIILKIGEEKVTSTADLKAALASFKAGDKVKVSYVSPDKDGSYDETAAKTTTVVLQ